MSGQDATKFVNRVITRDIHKVVVGQVIYCCWCDELGKVIDDGTISRLGENSYRWTAADPSLRWFHQNALGLDVKIEDISEQSGGAGAARADVGAAVEEGVRTEIANLKYFRVTHGKIGGRRSGYFADGIYGRPWLRNLDPVEGRAEVWDAMMENGRQFDLHPAGIIALDVARIEAGLIMLEVDYTSSKRALIESQKYSPYELGLGKMVDLKKEYFIGREALEEENRRGPKRLLMGLDVRWEDVERLYDAVGLAPQVQSTASRAACAGVSRRIAGGQGDFDDVVADAEKNDRAGEFESRARGGRDGIADGTDGGSGAS